MGIGIVVTIVVVFITIFRTSASALLKGDVFGETLSSILKNDEYAAFERLLKINGYANTDYGDKRWIVETETELRYLSFNENLFVYNKKNKTGVITDEDSDGCCFTGDVVSTFRYDDKLKVMIGKNR